MAYLLLALAAIFWGGNYVVGHILVQYVDPYGLSLIRWGATTALMLALYWRRFSVDFAALRKNLGINTLLSFLGQVSFPLSLYIGLQYTTSLNAAPFISPARRVLCCLSTILFFASGFRHAILSA